MESCLYRGWVEHRRFLPVTHRFRYRIFLVCLDLTDLPSTFAGSWTWSYQRPGLAWFRRSDHLGDPNQSLAESIKDLVEDSGRPRPTGKIMLVTHLRYFGFVMNPVSFYFCLDEQGQWATMVAEVRNTPWGQVHCYIVDRKNAVKSDGTNSIRRSDRAFLTQKRLHVSPFLDMEFDYGWAINVQPDSLAMHIENVRRTANASEAEGTASLGSSRPKEQRFFNVTMSLKKLRFNRTNRWLLMLTYPWMTLVVFLAIYWQAVLLWWKRVPYVPHPGIQETAQESEFPKVGKIYVSS
ncbi:MAG: DUF1365 domain-containing protein [Planctomycetaceae bacterium]|nr:DUF1365 domain-containing protein [Planctomycetaceae bacterium]